jgi:hypothetical protein
VPRLDLATAQLGRAVRSIAMAPAGRSELMIQQLHRCLSAPWLGYWPPEEF